MKKHDALIPLVYATVIGLMAAVLSFLLTGCLETTPSAPQPPAPVVEQYAWERVPIKTVIRGKPEWSAALLAKIKGEFITLDLATDMKRFCPSYRLLGEEERVRVWAEFWVAVAYYESLWDPKVALVDVGKPEKKDTWSVGLYQMSVVDQDWLWGKRLYSFEQLQTAEANIDLSLSVMRRQISRSGGLIVLPNSHKLRYWAVLLDGNKYSRVNEISKDVRKRLPICG